jgi:hypothetical protein
MNAKDLAIQLGVGVSTLIEYGNKANISITKASQELSPNEYDTLKKVHFGRFRLQQPLRKKSTKVKSISKTPDEFQTDNPFAQQTIDLIQGNNLFEKRAPKVLTFNGKKLESIFSDFEAASFCAGLDDQRSRSLGRKYRESRYSEDDLIEIHTIANLALEKYGSNTLSFVLSLPALPFKAIDATQIFSELDKRKNRQSFPILRISFTNQYGYVEKIQISFYPEIVKDERIRNDDVIIVKNQTRGEQLMRITRNGSIIPQSNAKSIIPILQLFIRFSHDAKKMIINYGLETGECSICGRELTDKESIRRGMGPVCYRG